MGRFYLVDTVEYLINLQRRRKSLYLECRFSGSLRNIYPCGALEWNFNWINNCTGGEKYRYLARVAQSRVRANQR